MTSEQKAGPALTRKSKWLWAVLTLFVAGWMFVLGLLVGRGTAPIPLDAFELSDELARLKAAVFQKEQAKVAVPEKEAANPPPNVDLGFFEELKKNQAQIPKQLSQVPTQPPKIEASSKPQAAEKKSAVETAPAAKSAMERKPEPTAVIPEKTIAVADPAKPGQIVAEAAAPVKPAPVVPAPLPPPQIKGTTGSSRYTIQIAAVKDAPGAEQLVTMLRGKNFPAYQLRGETPGQGVWYRVRVGAFSDRASAEAMRVKLGKEKIQGMVVATP